MALSGSQTASTTTDSSGNFTFSGLAAGGNYTVTPSASGYILRPGEPVHYEFKRQPDIDLHGDGRIFRREKQQLQSATYSTSAASLAVDGNTDGVYADGSVTIANYGANAWWQVDLGASATVNSIVIWRRTDCCGSCLSDYWVFVSDTPFVATDTPATLQNRAGTWSSHQTTAPNPSTTITVGGGKAAMCGCS